MKQKPWNKRKDNSKLILKAKQLRAKGLSYAEIGRRLKKDDNMIYYWLIPDYHKRQNKHSMKWIMNEYKTNKKFRQKLIRATADNANEKYATCKAFRNYKSTYDVNYYIRTRTSKKPFKPYSRIMLKTRIV